MKYGFITPPPGNGFLSFGAYQGRRLFDAFEESIQEFKWHYFKILPLPGSRPFWLDDEGEPFPWVYLNSEARECRITMLDPLETLAFQFLQSLSVGLGKKSNFKCCWILDHSDAEVGAFLDSLLGDMEKQSCYNRLLQKMAEVGPAVLVLALTTSVPLAPSADAAKAKKKSSGATAAKPFSVEREEGAKEDLATDLRQKKQNRKVPEVSMEEGPTRELLGPLLPEQLLGTAQHLACKLTTCLQVGVENAFAAKVQMEKDLAATKDQVDVLTVERDSALAAPLLNSKIKSLTQELELAEGERLSAVASMKEVEETVKVQAEELESCCAALERERKRAKLPAQSLEGKQTALDEAEAAVEHWHGEWKSLAAETRDMVQETFEILIDQVRHLNPAIDYSMISLDTRWDPKARRIYNPKAEAQE
ncbi:hypothetical protein PIB30_058060 [Stylosanthes scabra]|uniref:Uncharacterized protein n=1 Tax=Stylosanthes scabra TaxID=79078 RepID=A0ABU6ZII9_9FABA|nr:hypothetical protein [Stylosanthes scabra]